MLYHYIVVGVIKRCINYPRFAHIQHMFCCLGVLYVTSTIVDICTVACFVKAMLCIT